MRSFCLLAALVACTRPDDKAGTILPALPDLDRVDPELYLDLDALNAEHVLDVSEGALFAEVYAAAQTTASEDRPFQVRLGLVRGAIEAADLTLTLSVEEPELVALVTYAGTPIAEDGVYSVVDMMLLTPSPTCSFWEYPAPDPDAIANHKGSTAPTGGMCGTLAAAHSLVRKMGGIVPEDHAVETDGSGQRVWKPEFLRDVYRASGDDDGDRGLTDGQVEDTHEADWNDAWEVQLEEQEELYDDDSFDCEELEARCGLLMDALTTNDDIELTVHGLDGKDDEEWGHVAPVEGATFTAGDPCCCELTTTRTSRQEPGGASDFAGVPFQPGTAGYRLCSGTDEEVTVSNSEFPSATVTFLEWSQYDEEARRSSVRPTTQGNPGSALTSRP